MRSRRYKKRDGGRDVATPLAKMESHVYRIANLHCDGCEASIRQILRKKHPDIQQIQFSSPYDVVAVTAPADSLNAGDVLRSLYLAGFEVTEMDNRPPPDYVYKTQWPHLFAKRRRQKKHNATCKQCQHEKSTKRTSGASRVTVVVDVPDHYDKYQVTYSVGGMTCASCSAAVSSTIEEAVPEAEGVGVNLLGRSLVAVVPSEESAEKIASAVEDAGYSCQLVNIKPIKATANPNSNGNNVQIRAVIGGMTCASCAATITSLAKEKDYVKAANVDLLSHTGYFVLTAEKYSDDLKDTIENSGYDIEIISVTPVTDGATRPKLNKRTVELSVSGMHCEHCPPKVMSVLQRYGKAVVINDPLSLKDPFVRLTYAPDPPRLTVRAILSDIQAASPDFEVTIAHPKTIEDRAAELSRMEHRQILIRLLTTLVVAIPTFIIGVVAMSLVPESSSTRKYLEEPMWVGSVSRMDWALLFLATPVYFFCDDVFHVSAILELWSLWRSRNSWNRRLLRFGSMNLLISLGTSIAYFASIAVIALSATTVPETTDMRKGFSTTYFDSVVFLTLFLLAGRYLDSLSRSKMSSAVSMLTQLRPDTVNLVTNADSWSSSEPTAETAQYERMSTDMVEVGDYVMVLPGEHCSTDGYIVAGSTTFDESSLTGESSPVRKSLNNEVLSGTVNTGGAAVVVRVTAVDEGSMLSDIIQIVRQGQLHKAPIERIAERVTGIFVPLVTGLAVITWVIWLTLGLTGALPQSYLDIQVGGWPVWSLEFAITVFVVACPCGIGLAAPTALYVGSGVGAKYGILARGGGEAFQEASKVDIICFDKTGTLTEGGNLSIIEEKIFDAQSHVSSRLQLIQIAAIMEANSMHPLAAAVRRYAIDTTRDEQHVKSMVSVESLEEIPGRGMRGKVLLEGKHYIALMGNESFLTENNVRVGENTLQAAGEWQEKGWSVILLALQEESDQSSMVRLAFAAADKIRPESKEMISSLQNKGLECWMISGDNSRTARAVAEQCGISPNNVVANVLPTEKAEKIQWLQKTRKHRGNASTRAIVAMVGDGVNDAPALAVADVGIAIGSGADIALTSAKFVLLNSELTSLITLFELSRVVLRRVKLNFGWAAIYNIIGIPIAAGVIYPYNNTRLSPVWASLAMALSSLSVVTSSMLLRLFKPSVART